MRELTSQEIATINGGLLGVMGIPATFRLVQNISKLGIAVIGLPVYGIAGSICIAVSGVVGSVKSLLRIGISLVVPIL